MRWSVKVGNGKALHPIDRIFGIVFWENYDCRAWGICLWKISLCIVAEWGDTDWDALFREQAEHTREQLAEYAHKAWSRWMGYLFSKSTPNTDDSVTIPAWAVKRWKRQAATSYDDLLEGEKDSDRDEADAMLAIVEAP